MKKVLLYTACFLTVLPLWHVEGGWVYEMNNAYSDVDRNVRAVAVYEGKSHLIMDLTGWQLNLFDPVTEYERMVDRDGHSLAAQNAAEYAGVWLDQVRGGYDFANRSPMPDGRNVTGLSSTGSAFAEWYLFSTNRCLISETAFSFVALIEELEPIGMVDLKLQAVRDNGIRVFVVSTLQYDLPDDTEGVVKVGTLAELTEWIRANSVSC